MLRKQAAEYLEIDIETLRFYEKSKLVSSPKRLANGYREYTKSNLIELRFIQHCRSLGIGLDEIKVLKELVASPTSDCTEANKIIGRNLSLIERKIKDLKKLQAQLKILSASCIKTSSIADCKIAMSLNEASVGQNCVCHKQNKSRLKKI